MAQKFEEGTVVELIGLVNNSHLNGKRFPVTKFKVLVNNTVGSYLAPFESKSACDIAGHCWAAEVNLKPIADDTDFDKFMDNLELEDFDVTEFEQEKELVYV